METVLKPAQTLSVFILDDDKLYLEYLRDIIANFSLPVTICTFTDKDELLANLDSKPDFIIIDFNLGTKGADRITAHAIINTIEKNNPKQAIVLMSGEAIRPLLEEYYKHRNLSYLVKNQHIGQDLLFLLLKKIQPVINS